MAWERLYLSGFDWSNETSEFSCFIFGIWQEQSCNLSFEPGDFEQWEGCWKSLKLYPFRNIYWPSHCFIVLGNLSKRSIQSLFSKITHLWMINILPNILQGKTSPVSCFNNPFACFTWFKCVKTVCCINLFPIY